MYVQFCFLSKRLTLSILKVCYPKGNVSECTVPYYDRVNLRYTILPEIVHNICSTQWNLSSTPYTHTPLPWIWASLWLLWAHHKPVMIFQELHFWALGKSGSLSFRIEARAFRLKMGKKSTSISPGLGAVFTTDDQNTKGKIRKPVEHGRWRLEAGSPRSSSKWRPIWSTRDLVSNDKQTKPTKGHHRHSHL